MKEGQGDYNSENCERNWLCQTKFSYIYHQEFFVNVEILCWIKDGIHAMNYWNIVAILKIEVYKIEFAILEC